MPKNEFDPEDPMEFMALSLPGDTTNAMAECFVEEYALMGYHQDIVFKLFTNPFYVALHNVYKEKGEEYVRKLISDVYGKLGKIRFRTEVKNG